MTGRAGNPFPILSASLTSTSQPSGSVVWSTKNTARSRAFTLKDSTIFSAVVKSTLGTNGWIEFQVSNQMHRGDMTKAGTSGITNWVNAPGFTPFLLSSSTASSGSINLSGLGFGAGSILFTKIGSAADLTGSLVIDGCTK